MKSFGVWLHESDLTLSEIVALRDVATTLAQNWPIGSNQRTDYETSISTHLPAAAQPGALQQLRSVWPVYELDAHGVGQAQVGTGFLGFITQLRQTEASEQLDCARFDLRLRQAAKPLHPSVISS